MIAYFLGIPGSGKTYYGVNVIYDNFAKDIPKKTKLTLKKDYKNCYTNINEFNYKFTKKVYQFDYDVFFKHIKELHKMYKAKANDAELIEKAKEFKIYKTLFVIDECHNFFDTPKIELIWWLTYHRHLYHDIYLITQDLGLINTRYKTLAEAYYKAKPNSLTLDKRFFNYMYYTNSRMSKASYVNTIKIRRNQDVFKLYKSGDSVKTKNVVLRFVKIAFALFVLLILMGWYYFYHLKQESNNDKSKKQYSSSVVAPASTSKVINDNSSIDTSNLIYMKFVCNLEMCSYKDMYFDIKVLSFADKNFNMQIINSRRVFSKTVISVAVNSSFLTFLQGGSNDTVSVSDSVVNTFK